MKLHQILMRHAGQKSKVEFTLQYVLADSEDQILAKLNDQGGEFTYGEWSDREEWSEEAHDDNECGPDGKRLIPIYDDDYKVIGHETFLARMLRLRGEFNDEDADWDDAYYGIKHYGWTEGVEASEVDVETLRRFGVKVEDWRAPPAQDPAS